MIDFIKKNYLFILICVGIIIIGYLSNKIISLQAEAIGDKIAGIAMAAERAKLDKILAKYKPLIAKADKDLATLRSGVDDLNGKIDAKNNTITKQRKEIEKLLTCNDKLVATNKLLDECQGFTLWVKNEYNIKIGALHLTYGYREGLFLSEIGALTGAYNELITKYGSVVKELTIAKFSSRKRLNLGFFAGYSLGGNFAAGFGITFNLFKLPVKLF